MEQWGRILVEVQRIQDDNTSLKKLKLKNNGLRLNELSNLLEIQVEASIFSLNYFSEIRFHFILMKEIALEFERFHNWYIAFSTVMVKDDSKSWRKWV